MLTSNVDKPSNIIGSVNNVNGPIVLDVAYGESSPFVPLHLRVQNYQATSDVNIDSKFTGTFDIQSKLASVSVKEQGQDTYIVDSSGNSQYRSYVYDRSSTNSVKGWAGYGQRQTDPHWRQDSRVEIVSSLSPIVLQL